MEADISARLIDVITGHAVRTMGDASIARLRLLLVSRLLSQTSAQSVIRFRFFALAGRMPIMPKLYPKEFRDDIVAVARQGQAPLTQIAPDFGISETCLSNWMK